MEYLAPLILEDRVFVDVLEDLHLISPSINVESVLVPHKRVISPGFWYLIHLTNTI